MPPLDFVSSGAAIVKTILQAAILAATLLYGAAPALAADTPFYPSAMNTVTGLPVSPDQFTPAQRCAYCHPVQHEQWRGSMHANAFADPLYRAAWREASKELGGAMDRLCAGCHTPVGTAAEQVWIRSSGEIVIHPLAEEGVTCDFCHSVQSLVLLEKGGNPGNAGLVVIPDGPGCLRAGRTSSCCFPPLQRRCRGSGSTGRLIRPMGPLDRYRSKNHAKIETVGIKK